MARGVTIREQALGAAPIEALNISTIGIVGTAPGAVNPKASEGKDGKFVDEHGDIKYNEPILLTKRGDAPSTELGESGSLPIALDSIYAQGGAAVVVVIVEGLDSVPGAAAVDDFATTYQNDLTASPATTDYKVGEVSNQLSVIFGSTFDLTTAKQENLQSSIIGRRFTVKSSAAAVAALGTTYATTPDSKVKFVVKVVNNQLSIVFGANQSGAELASLTKSAVGRHLTIGTGASASVYAVAGSYDTTTFTIPVTHISGPTTFTAGSLNLALAAQEDAVFSIAGKYISASRRIAVNHVSGPIDLLDATMNLSLAQQLALDGEVETRTNATGRESDPDYGGEASGVYALVDAESVVGRKVRLIGAPGLDTGSRPGGAKNPLAAALEIVAAKLRGIAYIDGPNTNHTDALAFSNDFSTARTYILDPGVMVTDADGELVDAALSAFALGLTAKTDSNQGWWNAPSNRALLGIQKLKRPISYNPNDPNTHSVLLNQNGVATVIRYQKGFRLFGVRTSASPSTEPAFKFINVRRIFDNIEDSVQEAMFYYIDKNINKNFLRAVVDRSNAFIRNMVAQGALIGGECFVDGELNTPDSIALGKIYFNVKATPPYPAEEIIFTFNLTNEYLTSVTL